MGRGHESRLEIVTRWIMEAVVWFTSLILLLMMLLITYDVVMRGLFNAPSGWMDDFISLYLIIYVTMLPSAWILLKGEHVAVEVFVSMLGPAARQRMNSVTKILCLIYSVVLTWQGAMFTWRDLTHNTTFPTGVYMPVWPAAAVIFVGGLLLILASILRIFDHAWVQKHYGPSEETLG